jgi:hypothetical protein
MALVGLAPWPSRPPQACDTRVTNGTGRLFSSVKVKSPDKMQALPHNAELTLRVRHSVTRAISGSTWLWLTTQSSPWEEKVFLSTVGKSPTADWKGKNI